MTGAEKEEPTKDEKPSEKEEPTVEVLDPEEEEDFLEALSDFFTKFRPEVGEIITAIAVRIREGPKYKLWTTVGVFLLIAFESIHEAGLSAEFSVQTAGWTILLSLVLHGISAVPLASWYARRLETAEPDTLELAEVPELGVRRWDPLGWAKHHRPGGKEVPMS